jgi:hypothetical protein
MCSHIVIVFVLLIPIPNAVLVVVFTTVEVALLVTVALTVFVVFLVATTKVLVHPLESVQHSLPVRPSPAI